MRRAGVRMRQVTHQPVQHALHLRLRRNQQREADERGESRRQHDAGEQHPVHVPAARAIAQHEQQANRRERAGKRRHIHRHGAVAQRDRGQRAQRGAARNAENIGIGERIAQQHLQQRTRERKQAAAGKGGGPRVARAGPTHTYQTTPARSCTVAAQISPTP